MNIIRACVRFFLRNDVFCVAILWFMFILVIGTITQKEIGLYSSQEKYFTSNIIWLFDIIPVPGGNLIFIFIFIGLTIKLMSDPWNIRKFGTNIIHTGVLVLLLGAFITFHFSQDSFIALKEGEANNKIISNDEYNFSVLNKNNNLRSQISIKAKPMLIKKTFYFQSLPFNIKINRFYKNVDIINRHSFLNDSSAIGFSKFFYLNSISTFVEEKDNKSGVSFDLIYKNGNDKSCFLIEDLVDSQTVLSNKNAYIFELSKSEKELPFFLYLTSFEKKNYPGTNMSKSYKSKIIIEEKNGIRWKYDIEMNKPFRHKGYTFYQTSFIEGDEKNITFLTVVKNSGSMFPYISCFIISIGFLWHLVRLFLRLLMRRL